MSRISQTNAIWKIESPNWERNCAAQRNANGAGTLCPRPIACSRPRSGPVVTLAAGSDLLDLLRLELGRVVLEIPHHGRSHAHLAQVGVELSPVVEVLIVDDVRADEPGERNAPRGLHDPRDLRVAQGPDCLVRCLPGIGREPGQVVVGLQLGRRSRVQLLRELDLSLHSPVRDGLHRVVHVRDQLFRRPHVLARPGVDFILRDRGDRAHGDPVDGPKVVPVRIQCRLVHRYAPLRLRAQPFAFAPISFELMSNVIMKPLVPLNSNALSPSLYASISFGIRTKPSFRGVPKYLRLWITTGSAVWPWNLFRTTIPALPPPSFAVACSFVAVHSTGKSGAWVNDFHFIG